jgi:hypothetical protein
MAAAMGLRMRNAVGAALAVAVLAVSVNLGHAADAATCDAYVKEAVAKAQGVRQFNCGFDLNDPRWGTDRRGHAAWCKDADKETVEREAAHRRGEMKLCETCRAYANLATAAASDNARRKCGYEGARWTDKAENHFNWCAGQRERIAADEKDIAAAYKASLEKMRTPINLETTVRTLQVTDCKSRTSKARKRPGKR